MKQKLVGLFVGGRAIIARHFDIDVIRDQAALQSIDPINDVACDDDRIGPGALGERDRYGGRARPMPARPGSNVQTR